MTITPASMSWSGGALRRRWNRDGSGHEVGRTQVAQTDGHLVEALDKELPRTVEALVGGDVAAHDQPGGRRHGREPSRRASGAGGDDATPGPDRTDDVLERGRCPHEVVGEEE